MKKLFFMLAFAFTISLSVNANANETTRFEGLLIEESCEDKAFDAVDRYLSFFEDETLADGFDAGAIFEGIVSLCEMGLI